MKIARFLLLVTCFSMFAVLGAGAKECRNLSFDGAAFSICTFDVEKADIRLFYADEEGDVFGHFLRLKLWLNAQGLELESAMNGGMFHDDQTPVGHYKAQYRILREVITSSGPGNFGMLPNGLFCLSPGRALIMTTPDFIKAKPDCVYATQSGPMLVIEGNLHPRFLKDSPSLRIRNGVGISKDGKNVFFAIANVPVNLHHFSRLLRDYLGAQNALYIDGTLSRFYARELKRNDFGWPMGPILGVVGEKE